MLFFDNNIFRLRLFFNHNNFQQQQQQQSSYRCVRDEKSTFFQK